MEEWREIERTNGKILVSSEGRLRSLLRDDRLLAITIKAKKNTLKIHREVAKAFLSNDDNKPQINHIDGNKQNNKLENLEWVTSLENAAHAVRVGLWGNVFAASKRTNDARKKPIIATNLISGKETVYESMSDAERLIKTKHISAVISGSRKQAKGYVFRYCEGVV